MVAASVIVIFSSCEKDPDNGPPGTTTYDQPILDLSDASALVALETGEGHKNSLEDENSNLYKLTTDGTYEMVRFVNPDGSEVDPDLAETRIIVEEIFNLTDEYLVLRGDFNLYDTLGNTQFYQQLMIRKTDGAIFEYTLGMGDSGPDNFINSPVVRHDEKGNIYFGKRHYAIIRLLLEAQAPEYVNILPSGQSYSQFTTDKFGNCIYTDEDYDFKILKESGGLEEIETKDYTDAFWKGLDGKLYLKMQEYDENSYVYRLDYNDDNISQVQVFEDTEGLIHHNFFTGEYYKIEKASSILFIDTNEEALQSWEFFENDYTVEAVETPIAPARFYDGSSSLVNASNFLYMFNETKLYKVDLNDYISTKLSSDEYEFYNLGINANKELMFSALRYSDAKKVIGKITASDEIIILDSESDKKAIAFTRLD